MEGNATDGGGPKADQMGASAERTEEEAGTKGWVVMTLRGGNGVPVEEEVEKSKEDKHYGSEQV